MMMVRRASSRWGRLAVLVALMAGAAAPEASAAARKAIVPLEIARIDFEYNSSASDLGVHVSLDGEDWRKLTILSPSGHPIFDVTAKGPYSDLGLTELFFEGAEPSLDEVPLEELLERFPAGDYLFVNATVDEEKVTGLATLSHAIPAGPFGVQAVLVGDPWSSAGTR